MFPRRYRRKGESVRLPETGSKLGLLWPLAWRVAAVAATVILQVVFITSVPLLLTGKGSIEAPPRTHEPLRDLPELTFEEGHEPPPVVKEPAPLSTSGQVTIARDLYTGDLDGIMKRRNIRVLTTFNRTNFFIHQGNKHGFEYSLLRDYEKKLNEGRGRRDLKVHMEFIPVPRDELIPRLLKGEGDIAAAGLTITSARLEKVDFTEPYLTGIDEVVVTGRGARNIAEIEDLSGKKVHVRKSSSYYESLRTLNGRLKEKGLDPVKIAHVAEGLETEDIFELVSAGTLDITVADSHLAQIWSGVQENLLVHEHLKVRSGGRIAWMVRKGSPRLKASLDGFIRTRRKGTKFGNIYFNRYYKDKKWVARPLAREERKRLEEYKGLFQKYSDMYDIPWLFTAAVAYQESGFDNSKRSAAGAVGIMQVLPSTAADKNVGVPDIEKLENNIHAGVKYLDFLRDRYFADEEIDELNKIHFVLASYNAGPGNVRKARGKAGAWSVDDSRWFKNVEVVTLRTVSPEPVQYVVNIHRYHLLFARYFKNLEERKALKTEQSRGAGR
jgi:membrane-bound lytic murein transglycosylase MltF